MVRIAVIMPSNRRAHLELATTFEIALKKLVPDVVITGYVSECILANRSGFVYRDFDLIVTIGTKCTVFVCKELEEEGLKTPLLFIGAYENALFEGENAVTYKYLSGVSMCGRPDYFPLDAVFKICGVARRVVFVYREDNDNGYIEFVVGKMRESAMAAGVSVVETVCIKEGEALDAKSLSTIVQSKDIVIPVRGGRCIEDLDVLERVCKEKGADFVGIANGFVPETAICGYIGDVQYMSVRTAQLAKKIVNDKVVVTDLPRVKIADTTQIVINTAVATQRGVSLPLNDYIFSLDEADEYPIVYRTLYAFVWSTMAEQEQRLSECMTPLGRDRLPGIQCLPTIVQGLHNTVAHRKWVVEQTLERPTGPVVVVNGEQMARLLQQEMLKRKQFKSLVIVKSSDDNPAQQAEATIPGWPAERFIKRIILEVLSPRALIDFVFYLQPSAKKIGCIYSYEYTLMPQHLKDRLEALKAECVKRGLEFFHAGRGVSNIEFEIAFRKLSDKADVFVSFGDMLRPSDGVFAGLVCHEKNKLFIGSDLSRSDRCGAVVGLQHELIAQKIIDTVCDAAMGRPVADTGDLVFKAKDTYAWCVNDNWLKLHGLSVPEESFLAPQFTCVPALWDPSDPFGGVLRVANVSITQAPPAPKKRRKYPQRKNPWAIQPAKKEFAQ